MKTKKANYRDDGGEIVGDLRQVGRPRWLPSTALLAAREPKAHVKVTLDLSSHAVAFFKREARRHGGSYQRMIRRLVDAYVEKAG
jgi:hypothetical protein